MTSHKKACLALCSTLRYPQAVGSIPRHLLLAIVVATLACTAAFSEGDARATAYLPPQGKLFSGVGPGKPQYFERQTLTHPAVLTDYMVWNGSYGWFLARAHANHMRAMLSIITNYGSHEYITPGQIMRGKGDAWLVGLGQALAAGHRPTYLRIMAEMNGWWNPYSAFGKRGHLKPDHSPADFRQAWRRIVLIVRGGSVRSLNAKLHRLGMKPIRTSLTTLPRAPVAIVWNPETAGAPDIPANSARAFYPGSAYVDWVGADFFSRFPSWHGLNPFYSSGYDNKPFVFGEWSIWGADNPSWAKQFFAWVRSHRRVRMLVYYQGYNQQPAFNLAKFPRARAVIRAQLGSSLFAAFAAEESPSPATPPPGESPSPATPPGNP